ncbi:MAG: hypothetical protein L0H64_00305 [Pseudonocardia sp.]|nr:hypothetical protein [Pseudonocardia sp.]
MQFLDERGDGVQLTTSQAAAFPVASLAVCRGATGDAAPAPAEGPARRRDTVWDEEILPLLDDDEETLVDLGLQGLGQLPAGTLTDHLVDQRAVAAGFLSVRASRNYGEHGSCPSGRRWRADLA